MAHQVLSLSLWLLGVILIIAYYVVEHAEARAVKKIEGKMMLLPSAFILFVVSVIVYSGVLG
ncbi:MAG: hypothetical protein ACW99U_09325 [Candidatus Thorarchaeota archaeon]|jgi:hypothetical protein